MNASRLVVTTLLVTLLLGSLAPMPPPVRAREPLTFQGHLRYSEHGPGASTDGIGTALFVGGMGAPIATARLMTGLRTILSLPGVGDNPSMKSVSDMLNNGVPIDVATLVPGSARYDANVVFSLEEGDDGVLHLKEGSLTWTNTNHLEFSYDGGTITDDFGGSGSYTLDPSKDKIDLTLNHSSGETTIELEADISHPTPTNGNSEWNAIGGAFVMRLESSGGHQTMSGQSFGQPIPSMDVGGGVPEHGIHYYRQGTLSDLRGTETWRNLLDAQVLVEYELLDACTGHIEVPEDGDALAFDDSEKGVLEIDAVGIALPRAWGDDLVWRFPELPGSNQTCTPEDCQGANVTGRYEGLPEKNDDFGEVSLRMEFATLQERCNDPQEHKVRLFWDRMASNNPDGAEPNWFYYWKQTRAGQGHDDDIKFDSDCPLDSQTGEVAWYGYFAGFGDASETDAIYLCDWGEGHFASVNPYTGKYVKGIDHYASVVLHEWTHLENYHDWWGATGCYLQTKSAAWKCEDDPPEEDKDCDWVPDNREPAYGMNPRLTDTYGLGFPDSEMTAYVQEHTWPNGSANGEDWAKPGKQSGGS